MIKVFANSFLAVRHRVAPNFQLDFQRYTKLCVAFTVVEFTSKPPSSGGAATKKGKAAAGGSGSGGGGGFGNVGSAAVALRPILRQGLCTSWLEHLAMPMLLANEEEARRSGHSKRSSGAGPRGGRSSRSSTRSSAGRSGTSNSDVDVDVDDIAVATSPARLAPVPPAPIRIPVYIRETKEFALPANHKYPIIMIGPGTGVAPFIGFLEHRQRQCAQQSDHKDDVCSGLWRGGFELDGLQDDVEYSGQKINSVYGECVLFFGNRNRAKDFLYEARLNEFLQDGTLTQLHVAFSRDTQKKVYVQHKMLEQAASIYRMLVQENGYLYVCGDGAKMAKDVDRALLMILSTRGGKMKQGAGGDEAAERAKAIVEKLKKQGRYVKDVWS